MKKVGDIYPIRCEIESRITCPSCKIWRMAAEMVAYESAFIAEWILDEDTQDLIFLLNMSDVFAYATADCEEIDFYDIPTVYGVWKQDGYNGLIDFVADRRNCVPLKGAKTNE